MPTPINVKLQNDTWTAPANCTVVIYSLGLLPSAFTAGNVSGSAWPYGGSSDTNSASTNANPIVLSAGQQVLATLASVTGWTV